MQEFVSSVTRIVFSAMGQTKTIALLVRDLITCGNRNQTIVKRLALWEDMGLVIGLESTSILQFQPLQRELAQESVNCVLLIADSVFTLVLPTATTVKMLII